MDMEMSKETLDVGKRLVDLCKKGDNIAAIDELYSPQVQSFEAMASPGMPETVKGIEAVRKKNETWGSEMEVHSMDVEGPFPLGDRFAVHYKFDATERKSKKRMKGEEVALYTVSGGKIIKEEFFYTM